MASSDNDQREARKKKLRELEASLFGATNNWNNNVITGLPELQNVGEYSGSGFGKAERRKSSALSTLLKPVTPKGLFTNPKRPQSKGNYSQLLESEDDDEDDEALSSSGSSSAFIGTPPPLKPIPATTKERRKSSSTTSTLLRSEVQELDQSLQWIEHNPKQQVLDNIKRRHGITRSPSMDSHNDLFQYPGSNLQQVTESRDALSRASVLENPIPRRRSIASPLQKGTTANALGSKSDPIRASRLTQTQAPSLGYARDLSPGQSSEDGKLSADWPSMPEIKASMPIKGGRRDSLQPLPIKPPLKTKKLSLSKTVDLVTSPALASATPGLSAPEFNPFADALGKVNRLPAIADGKHVPKIKINTSPRPRRDPQSKTLESHPPSGLVSFEGLETSNFVTPEETFQNVPDALHDMCPKTFDSIPSDVFDNIPRAVSARQEERHKRFQEHEKQLKARVNSGSMSSLINPLEPRSEGATPEQGTINILTALFPNATVIQRNNPPDNGNQFETDFMFALFIQEKEQTPANEPNRGRRSSDPSASRPSSRDPRNDPEVGHFCAPWVPGFCEANFCIFHCSTRPRSKDKSLSAD
ncbi:hypothetical protein TCAL_16822 [Tigriopus californicus]|uniref:Uncharacterized protein n=1 Tax=Tigriopus californicus TaxID=6832 RepID=A0A553PA32_TIGCA|nr:uncharacterized protein LOC131877200 [Tigriopus californicus]TRY74541.1 hypothetical protein TCAL_16822 [Tigriopus californicus]